MNGTIVFRHPCDFHKNCDETAVGLLHRSVKDGQPKDTEKLCWVCEKVLDEARKELRTKGTWTCPVCNIVTTADKRTKTVSPGLSYWYSGLKVSKE